MNKKELINKIKEKKDFSELPNSDIEKALKLFENKNYSEEEKIKYTRDLLRKAFSAFTSQKLLNIKNKEPEWFLKKHLSTKERLPYYKEVYTRILREFNNDSDLNIFDLGAGINGLSYEYFNEINKKISYIGIESVGQLVDLMNHHFSKNKILNCRALNISLFDIENIGKIIKNLKSIKLVFLFKTIDSLEMIERDFSKKLLNEIVPLVDRVIVSFATKSLVKKKNFFVKRKWFDDFLDLNFKVIDDFILGGERYIIFCSKNHRN